jgi:hypothetical protein
MGHACACDDHSFGSIPLGKTISQQSVVHGGYAVLWTEKRVAEALVPVGDVVDDFWEDHIWL